MNNISKLEQLTNFNTTDKVELGVKLASILNSSQIADLLTAAKQYREIHGTYLITMNSALVPYANKNDFLKVYTGSESFDLNKAECREVKHIISEFIVGPVITTMSESISKLCEYGLNNCNNDPKTVIRNIRCSVDILFDIVKAVRPISALRYNVEYKSLDVELGMVSDVMEDYNRVDESIQKKVVDDAIQRLKHHSGWSLMARPLILTLLKLNMSASNYKNYTNLDIDTVIKGMCTNMQNKLDVNDMGIVEDIFATCAVVKKQEDIGLYIINKSEDISVNKIQDISVCDGQDAVLNSGLIKSLSMLNLRLYNAYYKLANRMDAFIMSRRKGYNVYESTDMHGMTVFISYNKACGTWGILCTDNENATVIVNIVDGDEPIHKTIKNLQCTDPRQFDISDKITVGRYEVINESETTGMGFSEFTKLIEGIDIDSEGNVKLSLPRNATYMDMYSSLHRMIVNIDPVNNREDLKIVLANMFQLIDETEQEMRKYANKSKEKKYRDAEKARMFLMNDFKTHLKVVQKYEPEFNFPKYYSDNGYDVRVYQVKHDSILGIKKLFKAIML